MTANAKTKRPTKIDLIKDHLRSGRSLTQLEALGLYGAYRLAARIHDLKAQGWNIETDIRYDRNGSPYAVYSLAQQVDHGLPERYVGNARVTERGSVIKAEFSYRL